MTTPQTAALLALALAAMLARAFGLVSRTLPDETPMPDDDEGEVEREWEFGGESGP